jgi:hypothetical protein
MQRKKEAVARTAAQPDKDRATSALEFRHTRSSGLMEVLHHEEIFRVDKGSIFAICMTIAIDPLI